jgi:hypothetical protein
LFTPRLPRLIGTSILMLLQVLILLTGNYAFFNLLTLALCFWGLDDSMFEPARNFLRSGLLSISSRRMIQVTTACVAVLMLIGGWEIAGMLSRSLGSMVAPILRYAQSLEIVNQYGLFAVMTTSRTELIVEGSDDGVNWRQYEFRYKPGALNRELPVVAPHQPRLDWQMWFAALGSFDQNRWVGGLVYHLLRGDKDVEKLLERIPFAKPPAQIRIVAYDYQFTTPQERERTGAVWQRRFLGIWLNPVSLRQ